MQTRTWERSFVVSAVALGVSVDDAVAALAPLAPGSPVSELASVLRSTQRALRAGALAQGVREIVLALEEGALR